MIFAVAHWTRTLVNLTVREDVEHCENSTSTNLRRFLKFGGAGREEDSSTSPNLSDFSFGESIFCSFYLHYYSY